MDDLNPTGYSQVVEEIVGGAVQRVYTHGSMLISQTQLPTGTTSYYGYDAQGNVTFLTDDKGTVTDTYAYDAYGNLIASTGAIPNDYRYGGQRWDADLGAYDLRARSYDPGRGRFLSADTFAGDATNPISLNKYLYANANPVNLADPSGYAAAQEYGGMAAGVAGALNATTQIVLRAAMATGGTAITVSRAAALGYASACVFYTAWSGLEQLQGAATQTIAQNPPFPFENCRVRLNPVPLPRPIPFPLAPTKGDCPDGLRNEMQRAVNELCKRPRSCTGMTWCSEIRAAIKMSLECAQARDRINRQCFSGGDITHQEQADNALKTMYKCEALLATCSE